MPEKSNSVARKRSAQLSVRIDDALYEDYKNLLAREGISMTNDIETYIASRLGRTTKTSNVIDMVEMLKQHQQEIQELKATVGELKADWPQKTSNSKAS